ncbi:vacuolar protein sorting-associated protein 9A-like isoform X3 [Magnolia sinica]|uniref:vacuolar protein sorting-associated protein 9A-like isoform X3 n=1 Tax=Magnolia sinica TaxID=86752 RepID=UPI002659B9F6|nr:vacuolar protein sorting-associated protein 9A-like isoform X3 [Magnolia sinica]
MVQFEHCMLFHKGLEKYAMTKLFNRTFASSSEDVKSDQEISEKIHLLQHFVRPEHLDIPVIFQNEASWLIAVKELQKINSSRAPREKLLCILNCCRVINNLLLNVSMSTDHIPAGADDFLPVLIYVTIKANPPQLHSNLKFIQLFRRQSKLISEAAYYLTNLISAESFIMALDANSLSIGENEFHESMQAARLAEAARIGSSTTSTSSTGHVPTMRRCNEDIDTRGRKYPYMEAEAEDLTLEDVPKLLSAYKDVVTKYSMLRKAVRGLSLNEETLPSILREDLANCVLQQLEMTELEGSNSAQHGTGR